MPKKTRAAASNAVAAEVDSGDESALAPKGGDTCEAELELRSDVEGSAVGAPYLSLGLGLAIAPIQEMKLPLGIKAKDTLQPTLLQITASLCILLHKRRQKPVGTPYPWKQNTRRIDA